MSYAVHREKGPGAMIDMRPKMLLFSHLCSSGFVTGAEKLLLLFARLLSERYQCVLVVPREGIVSTMARAYGIPVIVFEIQLSVAFYVASPQVRGHLEELKGQFAYQQLLSLLVRERPQFVFTNTCVHPLPAVAARSLGIPVIWTLMELIHPASHRSLTLDIIHESSDMIVGISRTTLWPFRGHAGESKTHVLSPYVAVEELDPASWPAHRSMLRQQYGWSDQHCVIGFIAGTIYRQKGLESFILAARQVYDPGMRLRFLVVGNPLDEEHMQACRALVGESGMSDRFAWIRFAERIEQVYPAMDMVVVPSLQEEGFGMTALEGMYFGKPVVAYASGGLAEILQATGNERFLAQAGNTAELADRMKQLVYDDELRQFVGERNQMAANAAFGADSLRTQLDGLAVRLPMPLPFMSPLIRGSGKTVYLVENRRRRPFTSVKALLQRGFRFEDVRQVTDRELRHIKRGEPIAEWPEFRPQTARAAGKRRRLRGRRRYRLARVKSRGGRLRIAGRRRRRAAAATRTRRTLTARRASSKARVRRRMHRARTSKRRARRRIRRGRR